MNKKTTGLLCLAAGLLVGAAIAAPSSIALVKANEGAPVANAQYAIELPSIDGVSFNVKDHAAAGEVVEIRLLADESKISYTGDLFVNGWKASRIDDNTFKFVMPAEKAIITLEYGEVEAEVTTYNVVEVRPEGMYFDGLNNAYEAGANVQFKITFDAFAGITWNGVLEIFTNENEDKQNIEYAENNGYFTFEMPAKTVFVKAEAEHRDFNLKRAEGDQSSYKAFGDIELLVEDGDPIRLFEGGDLFGKAARVEFKSMVRVHMRNFYQDVPTKGAYAPLGFRIKETRQQFLLEEGKDYIDIEMPGRDISLEAIVTDRNFGLTLGQGEHTSIEVYHKDEDGNFVKDTQDSPTALYGETLYVRVPSDSADFGASKLHVLAVNEARDSSGNPVIGIDRDIDFDPNTGYYAFTINGIFESIALNVTEAAALANPTPTCEEHISATLYVAGNDGLVELDENHHAIPGNMVFVKVSSDDGEYGGKVVSGTYAKDDESTGNISFVRNGEYFVATLPVDAISFTVNATEQKVYNNTGLVGKYVGRNYTVSSNYSSNNSYLNEVTPAGTFAYSSYTAYAMQEFTPASDGATFGTFTAKKGSMEGSYSTGYTLPETQDSFTSSTLYRFAYGEKVIAWQESAKEATDTQLSPFASPTSIAFAFKANEASDEAFAFYTAKVTDNNNVYVFGQAVYGEEVWANVFVNVTTGDYKIDNQLEINLLAGDNIGANDAFFSVFYAGDKMLDIGSDSKGNKVLLDNFQGEWTVGSETLNLDGINKATYGGNEYKYVLDKGTLTLTRTYVTEDGGVTETIVINSFDWTARTATLVSQDASDPVPYVVNLESANAVISGRTTSAGFVYDDATGVYTSDNKAVSNSNAEMSIVAYKTIQISFDYETSGDWSSTSDWDYFAIFKNNIQVAKFGDTSGSYAIVLNAGDVLSLVYSKDGTGNGSTGEIDGVIISSLRVMTPGNEAGTYTVAGKTEDIVLDGYGHGTYGEVSFNYSVKGDEIEPVMINTEIVERGGKYYKEGDLLSFDMDTLTATDVRQSVEMTVGTPIITYSDATPFTYNDANGTYTSGNAGVGSSNSYMYIEAAEDGVISFDYETGGEGGYDYATISVDGVEKFTSKTSGTADNHTSGTFSMELKKGQKVTIRFTKDGGSDIGMDSIVISNLVFLLA